MKSILQKTFKFLRTPAGLWMLAAIVVVALPVLVGRYCVNSLKPLGMQEDAFIGLRHMRNFVEHGKLVYNVSDNTMGATSPLFWILSGIGYWILHAVGLAGDLVSYHYNFVWFCWAATIAIFFVLAKGALRLGLAAYILLCVMSFSTGLYFMLMGLESPFLTLSIAVIALLVRRGAPTRVVLLVAGVLAWGRPEAAIVAAPVLAVVTLATSDAWITKGKNLAALAAGWAVPPVLLFLFTGQALPNTVAAKYYFGASTAPLKAHPLKFMLGRVHELSDATRMAPPIIWLILAVIVGYALLKLFAYVRERSRELSWELALVGFTLGYTGFVLTVPNLWGWYITFWLVFCLITLGFVFNELFTAMLEWRPLQMKMVVGYVCAAALLFSYGQLKPVRQSWRNNLNAVREDRNFRGRLSVDLDTRWHASSVWMEAVGWQGYYNEARVYDEVGLVDRNVFDLVAKYRCGYFMAGLRTLKPQFIVKRKFEVDGNKMMIPPQQCPGAPLWANDAERAEFDRMYRVAATYDTQTPEAFGGFSHLVLFQRQDTQAATAQ